jgi:TolB protein
VECHPSLSSDGEFVVYASKASGNWDIYLQRVSGDKPINLTEDSPSDDTEPSLSAGGEWIAFRSERSGGGIFVMGATGENVRKVTDFGFNPAWSPDGTEIVCNINSFPDPLDRTITPEHLWAVNVSTGEKRLLISGDGVQGNWSPNGLRIAYWAVHQGGQRDIWTIPASGGDPVQVTRHGAVDWNPVWSPDGRYLYFVSDRGGSMNLWRVPVDERTGHVQGTPEPVTTPSAYSQYPSFSRDGRRLAYVQLINRVHLQEVGFDAESGNTTGPRHWVMQGPRLIKNPDLSADGEWFVFDSIDNKQEDLFVARRDGTVLSQITQDVYKDRAPRWSPDGKKIAFLSDRSGRYEAWTINPDGSGLEQITHTSEDRWAQAPIWSPDGTRIACNLQASAPFIFEVGKPWNPSSLRVASPGGDFDTAYFAWSWSLDGSKIAGARDGIVVFDLETEQLEQLTDFGFRPIWLNDGRRLIFLYEDKIHLVDNSSKEVTEVLSAAPHQVQSFGISKDNRRLYFSLSSTEADIWLASMQ